MDAHLASCTACTTILKRYALCSTKLKRGEELPFKPYPAGTILLKTTRGEAQVSAFNDTLEIAKERVWQSLPRKKIGPRPDRALWKRKVSLPLPAAAAAAVLLLFLAGALLRRTEQAGIQQDMLMAGNMELIMQDIMPVSDMDGVLQYLGNQDSSDVVVIRLPESKSFISSGEPTVIKAADYSRRNQGR
jgi:hypothetical protein